MTTLLLASALFGAWPARAQAVPAGSGVPCAVMVIELTGRMKPVPLPPFAVPESIPERFRDGLSPLFDEEQEHAVIGFVHSGPGIFRVFDLEGRLVRMHELGLKPPAIDPINVFAGGVAAGLAKGAVVAGVTSAARSVASGYLTAPYANLGFWKGALKGGHAAYLDDGVLRDLRAARRNLSTLKASPGEPPARQG